MIESSCFGLKKVWMTVAEMKEKVGPNEEEIKALKQKIIKWEEAASADKVDEETAKRMKFTGKCIVV